MNTNCCVVGGGPAGMILGLALARAGIDVVVIEKHQDFLRDFRGNTIHASTLELINQLGYLDEFLNLPHQKVHSLTFRENEQPLVDFSLLPTQCKFIVRMEQWQFLNFLAEKAKQYPNFQLLMQTEALELLKNKDEVTGIKVKQGNQFLDIKAHLVVSCEGRKSLLRNFANLPIKQLGAPIDLLWFKLSRCSTDPRNVPLIKNNGKVLLMFERGDYWQCALVIPKGTIEDIKKAGISGFRQVLVDNLPWLDSRQLEITSFEQLHLLSVSVNRLSRWFCHGFLCIGDAAHAMSPVGGTGINLAIQDAIAAANILIPALQQKSVNLRILKRVQKRRLLPTTLTQALQVAIHNKMNYSGTKNKRAQPNAIFRLVVKLKPIKMLFTRIAGMGIQPEKLNG